MRSSILEAPAPLRRRLLSLPGVVAALVLSLDLTGCSTQAGSDGGSGGTQGHGASSGAGSHDGGGPGTGGSTVVIGGPGCGFEHAAFCDTFDARSAGAGRAGELDPAHWSGSRLAPQGPTVDGHAFGVAAATLRPLRDGSQLPACRSDLPDEVFPSADTLICDASSDVNSSHLLVAVASQNYGQNSYRIRQPFDFEGRTGRIVFDAEGLVGGLLGWISLDLTEDPIGAPSFQTLSNLEGGVLPKNGLSIQFNEACFESKVSVSEVHVFDGYVETILGHDQGGETACVDTAWGRLNHFEVEVSQGEVAVYGSPFASDLRGFEPPVLLWRAPVSLPFSRGYVQITTHNHATLKYSEPASGFGNGFENLDAWITRWDNVGFDGPVIAASREYEASPVIDAGDDGFVETGWTVPDQASGPPTRIVFPDVDLAGATRARVALNAWYCGGCGSPVEDFVLRYRMNGNAWHDRPLDPGEVANITTGNGQGAFGHMLDVPVDELMAGKNTLELATSNVPMNYPPAVVNVDLVLGTE
jgi:hypothetical protein